MFIIPNIDESLGQDYHNGLLTIEQVAAGYFEANFTCCIDIDYALRKMYN